VRLLKDPRGQAAEWGPPIVDCVRARGGGSRGDRVAALGELTARGARAARDYTVRAHMDPVRHGRRLVEPAADLAMITALISTYLDRPLPADLVVWGEVGLAGEVRGVGHSVLRAAEASKLGFATYLMPKSNAERLSQEMDARCIGVRSLQDVLQLIFEESAPLARKPQ